MAMDKDLMKKIRAGDSNAFKELFDQTRDYVYNLCFRMTGNHEEAEDSAQEVYLKLYRSMRTFRGDSKLSTWIFRITVNTCLSQNRRKKLIRFVTFDFLIPNEHSNLYSSEKGPDRLLEDSETEQIVRQAIEMLPKRQKTALVLHRYADQSCEEIARIMEISLSAVESLIHRAKKNLAVKLTPLKKELK